MPKRLLTHLRHIALGVPDLPTQHAFYDDVWGLDTRAVDGDTVYLGAAGSAEPYIVRLRAADAKRVDLLAFGASNRADVDTLAARLIAADVTIASAPSELNTPGGGYGMRFFDNEGRTIEVSAEVEAHPTRQLGPGEAIPVTLSHVVLNSPTPEETVSFWERHLEFTVSDHLTMPGMGGLMWFLRCNAQHHSIAIARGPHASLHHASFEMRGIDEYMYATGRVKRAGAEFVWGPGKHLAGSNTFSYFLDPAGNTVEFTTMLDTVDDDTWEAGTHSIADPMVADQWGTANPMSAEVAAKSFNTPDAGLFAAPPV